jgi:hypothetical protein
VLVSGLLFGGRAADLAGRVRGVGCDGGVATQQVPHLVGPGQATTEIAIAEHSPARTKNPVSVRTGRPRPAANPVELLRSKLRFARCRYGTQPRQL